MNVTVPAYGGLELIDPGSGEDAQPNDADRLQTLAYEVTVAEARERERLANGLHDTLGQILAVAQFRLGELEAATGEAERRALIDDLRQLLGEASRETRRATFDLHSPVLEQLGLEAAIHGLADRLRLQCRLRVSVSGTLRGLPAASAEHAVVLRVVRELLLNASKHAKATSVHVALERACSALRIAVDDDGVGCDAVQLRRAPGPDGGFGLASGEAQMRAIGGSLRLLSRRGRGTTAIVTLPDSAWQHAPAGT